MMPPPVDPRDEVYGNPPDNSYRRSPVGSRETSMQPLYQHMGGYPNLHRPPHTRLSPQTDYSSLPGPPRRPSHYPNPYTYYERSTQPSERASVYAQRSQSPASHVPPPDWANQMPSRSPRTVYSNIPGFVKGDERQARMPSQPPHAASSNISGLAGGDEGDERQARMPSQPPHTASSDISGLAGSDERHAKSPLAPNCKTPEPAGDVSIPSTRPHVPPPATASSTPVVVVNTSQPLTPTSSNGPKKPGRPSNKSLGLIASTFVEVDEMINGLASLTGMTRMQLIARWLGDTKGPGSHTHGPPI